MTREEIITGLREGRELISYRTKEPDRVPLDDEILIDSMVNEGVVIEKEISNKDGYIGYSYKLVSC